MKATLKRGVGSEGRRRGGATRRKRWLHGATTGWLAGAGVVVLLGSTPSSASQSPSTGATDSSPEQAETRARRLLETGRVPEAISRLKTAIERHPSEATLHWLLARAYLLDGNEFWALRSLGTLIELRPGDCEPLLWVAWIQVRQGLLDEARQTLSGAPCEPGTPAATRRALIGSMVEHNDAAPDQARALFERARRLPVAYAEDRRALRHLAPRLVPGHLPSLVARLDVSAGWVSNARAGSPTDPATRGTEARSPAGQVSAWLRWVPRGDSRLRPTLEGRARGMGFGAEAGRDYSTVSLAARPGLLLGRDRPSLLVAYSFETLLLAGGDRYDPGPLWFDNAHRGELELSLPGPVMVFGGAGRRLFRESGRSRTEIDAGVGSRLTIGSRVSVLGALTARWHDAGKDPYDLWGGSLLASSEIRLPKAWTARLGALVSLDEYPDSAGYFEPAAGAVSRRDTLLKLSASGFAPPLESGAKIGVTYEYAKRFSTTDPYDYQDHRLLIKLIWPFSRDSPMPRATSPAGHVALEYGLGGRQLEERIQDLLRQDEAVRRSSACVE